MKKILLIVFISFIFVLTSCSDALVVQKTNPIFSMDTIITLTFYNVDDYLTHYNKVKEIYDTYDTIASDFTYSKGNVSDLNTNREIEASQELCDLVSFALEMQDKTDGYYNPLIGKLSKAWKEAISKNQIVSDDVIREELESMNHSSISIKNNIISITGNANLDLGGIAKGYATKLAKDYLDSKHITSYLLNAGSSNVVLGDKKGGSFKVSLDAPYSNDSILLLNASHICIASSSGKYQNTTVDGVLYHHLINPYTGKPSIIYDNVNVICENSAEADAYSTAIFMMEIDKAKDFAEKKNIDILLYKGTTILYQSSGWSAYAQA